MFDMLVNKLRQKGLQVLEISKARVPLLNVWYKQMLWVDVSLTVVLATDISPRNLLPVDEASGLSLRSVLVSMSLYERVCFACEDESDYVVFTDFLKTIKTWAINRQLYGQTLCFLGGVSFSILCANIFLVVKRQQPTISQSELLFIFFSMYSKWDW